MKKISEIYSDNEFNLKIPNNEFNSTLKKNRTFSNKKI